MDWLNSVHSSPQKYMIKEPFLHAVIDNFLIPSAAEKLLKHLAEQSFEEKKSDLFQFMQTADLTAITKGPIREFQEFLKNEGHAFFSKLGIRLKPVVDLHGTLYQDTDYLLCHDDLLEDRALAFLLYLADMKESDGGGLALYDSGNGKPVKIAQVIQPAFNRLALFQVSPLSFHSVLEVVADKQRIALGGWYHA